MILKSENMKLLGKSWKYINEGNVHIVVQILDTGYVLRLIKEDEKTVHPKNVYDSVNFINLIMVPLLENNCYGNEETIEISKHDSVELSKMLLPFRPTNRTFKSVISQIAIKATNLCIVSPKCETNYCIEIKPKEGFISSSLKKYSKCYYCLKQHLKLQMGAIKETTYYCPLDLFSGNKGRMKHSLLELINNPQNNFKLFKDGTLIFHEKSSLTDLEDIIRNMNYFNNSNLFLDFIIEILMSDKNNPNIIHEESINIVTEGSTKQCIDSNNIKHDSFLYKLLQLQKLSETLPFDLKVNNTEHMDYVSKLIGQINSEKLNLNILKDRELFLKTANPIHLALISAVAKDCSIMISFSKNYVENVPLIKIGDSKIFYKLAVTDLEPKAPTTLSKRKDTERKIIEVYEKYIESLNKE